MFDAGGDAGEIAGEAFQFEATENGGYRDAVFPEAGDAHPGGGGAEGALPVREVAAVPEGLLDEAAVLRRVAGGDDTTPGVAEKGVEGGYAGKHEGDVADRGPSLLEGDVDVFRNHPGKHQGSQDKGHDEGNLDEIFEGADEVFHFLRRRLRTKRMTDRAAP